jgi:hypothetical protein
VTTSGTSSRFVSGLPARPHTVRGELHAAHLRLCKEKKRNRACPEKHKHVLKAFNESKTRKGEAMANNFKPVCVKGKGRWKVWSGAAASRVTFRRPVWTLSNVYQYLRRKQGARI